MVALVVVVQGALCIGYMHDGRVGYARVNLGGMKCDVKVSGALPMQANQFHSDNCDSQPLQNKNCCFVYSFERLGFKLLRLLIGARFELALV